MKTADARKLKVGDWVLALFGGRGNAKACEITAICWPVFVLRTRDHKGREMIRTRRYQSLCFPCQPVAPPSVSVQAWLTFPANARP